VNPEIPLSDVWDECAIDAEILGRNAAARKIAKRLPPLSDQAKQVALTGDFEAMLSEAAFERWTGIPRKRPKPGEQRDFGDVEGGGSVKSAPDFRDVLFRKQQNWAVAAWQFTHAQWIVFLSIEKGRDLGPITEWQSRMASKCLFTRRWIERGRWLEPLAVIRGWLPNAALEVLPPRVNEEDGQHRLNDSWRLVGVELIRPWPDHPRPISAWLLRDLLAVEPREEERQSFLDGMKRSLYPTD
jgi:hypothetical protein